MDPASRPPESAPVLGVHPEGGNTLLFFREGIRVGRVNFEYDGSVFSDGLDNREREYYLAYIEVETTVRRQGIAKKMLQEVIRQAWQAGATVITLKIDQGCGYRGRSRSDGHLERLYQNAGFSFIHEDDLNEGAMWLRPPGGPLEPTKVP